MKRTFDTADGWRLVADHLPARGEARGVVVVGHAMMCNRRTLDRPEGSGLGSVLAAAGFETWLVDLRGHGESGPAPSRDVAVRYDDFVRHDIPAALRHAAADRPDLPLALVGHSLTAHAGLAALGVDPSLPVRAVVSLAGTVWIRALEVDPAVWLVKRSVIEAWGLVSRAAGRFPARRLGVGTDDEAADYVAQFVANARSSAWRSLDGAHDYLLALRRVPVPILSVVGASDRLLCRPEWAAAFLAHARRATVEHRVVGVRPGDPTGIDHMGLVTNPAMRPVWHEIAAWVAQAIRSG